MSEPSTNSWDDFIKLVRNYWDGVRNFKACNYTRNYVREMR
ncbi:MAG: EVE domain-containing protein [Cytophagales bacterium]|nr:EVE domain-containing protein [Cytophagales bacterium]